PRSTEEMFFAVRRLLETLAADTALLLDLLAEWVQGAPVLLLCLARPELREVRQPLTEQGRRVHAALSLEGLDAQATEQLAAGLLGVAALPRDLLDRLPTCTEGNPLFVRELVRMLAADGVIARVGDSYELTIDAEALEVPPTIQSLQAARVERLPDDERRLVELTSVIGTEFPRGAVAAMAPDLGQGHIGDLVDRLRRKELVDSTGTYWGDEPLLRFHHVLIRDAAYRRILKGARADLHTSVASTRASATAHVLLTARPRIAPVWSAHCAYARRHGYLSQSMIGLLDDATREHLHAIGNPKRLRDDQVLFRQGDDGDSVFLVETGRLRIVLSTPAGRELLVAEKGPGELVGELACLDHRERTATAIAEGPVTGVVIGPEPFLDALTAHGDLAVALLRELASQVRKGDERIASRATEDTHTRLAAQLSRLCDTYGEHTSCTPPIELRISQDDLAAWIGTTRETVGRSLARLRGDGIVSTGRQRIHVHDPLALETLALG
ncbi:MAG: cyclic nucleotide-binding domain-containing protein, partial [Actinomycetota bacterium]|nr:cyclic nucleotide-binding domain-containing protein [Actinomycetota bacterium]